MFSYQYNACSRDPDAAGQPERQLLSTDRELARQCGAEQVALNALLLLMCNISFRLCFTA
jgi:hypothetical protein